MVIYSHLATTMVPHRTQFLLLAALLIPTIVCPADFYGPVVSTLDGDTIEVLHPQATYDKIKGQIVAKQK